MSKKAERIYEDTADVIEDCILKGVQFDSTMLVYGKREIIYRRTARDLMRICEQKMAALGIIARQYENHPDEALRWKSRYEKFAVDVETARRMYLSIKDAEQWAI